MNKREDRRHGRKPRLDNFIGGLALFLMGAALVIVIDMMMRVQ